MGIIRALTSAIGGGLADQWLEVIESDTMHPTTITAPGVVVRPDDRRNSNKKGTAQTVSNGSIIHVQEGQFMLLTDGGKIVDYTAEAGYYKVDNSSLPSLFSGKFGDALKETFRRVQYSGSTPLKQEVYFINLQEVRGLRFGTPTPVNYYDNFYNAELFLRAHGSYSIRVTDPIRFYIQVADHDASKSVEADEMSEQFRNEFLTAFQSSLNQMSADGQRISFVASKGQDLAKYMQDVLDEKWESLRGFQIESVGIASISYDEQSQKLIDLRNQGAMLSDPSIREGYVQGAVARGLEAAGSNEAGASASFLGMGIGMNAMGAGMGQFSQANQAQMAQQRQQSQNGQGLPGPATDQWTCPRCGRENTGKFCSECGYKKPEQKHCTNCGAPLPKDAKFCPQCGHPVED